MRYQHRPYHLRPYTSISYCSCVPNTTIHLEMCNEAKRSSSDVPCCYLNTMSYGKRKRAFLPSQVLGAKYLIWLKSQISGMESWSVWGPERQSFVDDLVSVIAWNSQVSLRLIGRVSLSSGRYTFLCVHKFLQNYNSSHLRFSRLTDYSINKHNLR